MLQVRASNLGERVGHSHDYALGTESRRWTSLQKIRNFATGFGVLHHSEIEDTVVPAIESFESQLSLPRQLFRELVGDLSRELRFLESPGVLSDRLSVLIKPKLCSISSNFSSLREQVLQEREHHQLL